MKLKVNNMLIFNYLMILSNIFINYPSSFKSINNYLKFSPYVLKLSLPRYILCFMVIVKNIKKIVPCM